MGYTTKFKGAFNLSPALTMAQYSALCALHDDQVPLSGGGVAPPSGYCQWEPSKDGKKLSWDQGEKFYDYVEWLVHICAWLRAEGVKVNGEVSWRGEDRKDVGVLEVVDNVVTATKEALVKKGATPLETARAALEKIKGYENDDSPEDAAGEMQEIAKAALEAIK